MPTCTSGDLWFRQISLQNLPSEMHLQHQHQQVGMHYQPLTQARRKASPKQVGTHPTPEQVRAQVYTVAMPKLLELQEKYGMSDTFTDQLFSLLHNKIMHPGNSCPAGARKLTSKSSRAS